MLVPVHSMNTTISCADFTVAIFKIFGFIIALSPNYLVIPTRSNFTAGSLNQDTLAVEIRFDVDQQMDMSSTYVLVGMNDKYYPTCSA